MFNFFRYGRMQTRFILLATATLFATSGNIARAAETCASPGLMEGNKALPLKAEQILEALLGSPDAVFPTLSEAVQCKSAAKSPIKFIETDDKKYPKFPSYSHCKQSFFRVATINKEIDAIISKDGWKSGWVRREDELKSKGLAISPADFDALPPETSFEDRIIQYVRVKGKPSQFPKHSTVVGLLENPIRALSVGYHTGYNAGIAGDHMRLDEIEVGECAAAPACQKIKILDSTKVFEQRNLKPRYSTEGEWAADMHIPKECIVATYRIRFQKVDEKCYSDANKNCGF